MSKGPVIDLEMTPACKACVFRLWPSGFRHHVVWLVDTNVSDEISCLLLKCSSHCYYTPGNTGRLA
jgi:hypothetical protein